MRRILYIPIFIVYLAMIGVYLNAWISPSQLLWLSFLSLGYLAVVVFYMLSLLLAYKISKPIFIMGIIIFFSGIKFHLNYFSMAQPNQSNTTESLKILSYNVRLFNLYEAKDAPSKDVIFSYLKEQKADIYCFQEFYQQDPPTKFVTKDKLIKLLNTPNIQEHYSFLYRGRQYFGVIMMTHFPVIEKGDVSFEDSLHSDHNYCIYMDVVPKIGDTIRVYNAHLQSIKLTDNDLSSLEDMPERTNGNDYKDIYKKLKNAFLKREMQTKKILDHISKSPYPIILTGDFNDPPMSYTYHQFRKFLSDAFVENKVGIGATYAGRLPIGRIDYILHSKGLNPFDFAVQKEAFTDHHAISCKFNY